MSEQPSNWFAVETDLLSEVKRFRSGGAPPRIAGYDNLTELKRGGQGVVYAASQISTGRKVAIKVLHDAALASPFARRRFEREIDLIARLRHPHIVALHDSGVTDDDRPYLVMEFVEGRPLDAFVRSLGPASPGRARKAVSLFADIAEAVQYAHGRGVIHRDLKPSNIRIDPAGAPRVLDFGLAKVSLAPGTSIADTSLAATISASGQFMGSLAWASPEQAAGKTHDADVRTDVYSLGVMLYAAVTDEFPYDVKSGLRKTLEQIETAEPRRPSTALPWVDDELETIILRCLAKEPSRRYQTAGELAADLRRYLKGEAIAAKADSTWYTLKKTVRRHRGLVASLAALLFASVTLGIVMSALYARATGAEQEARNRLKESEAATARANLAEQDARDRLKESEAATARANRAEQDARDRLREVEATVDFLRQMVESPDPNRQGRDAKVIDVLARAQKQLTERTDLPPASRAGLIITLANTCFQLGDYERADALLSQAIALREQLGGKADTAALRCRSQRAYALVRLGRHDDALADARAAVELAATLASPDDRAAANTNLALGYALSAVGKLDESIAAFRAALNDCRASVTNEATENAVNTARDLAVILRQANRLNEAEDIYKTDLVPLMARIGERSPTAANIKNNYGSLLHSMQRFDDAQRNYEESITIYDATVGPDHDDTIIALNNLALLHFERAKYDLAEPLARQAVERATRAYGRENPTTLTAMSTLAKLLELLDRLDESLALSQETLRLRAKALGPEHPHTLLSMGNLAAVYSKQKRDDLALETSKKILDIQSRTLGPKHRDTCITRNNVGMALLGMKRAEEALAMISDAVDGTAEALGEKHWIHGAFMGNKARCLMTLNRSAEAKPVAEHALSILLATLGENHPKTKQVRTLLDQINAAIGDGKK